MDFYTNVTFKVHIGLGLGSRDPISNIWDPLITFPFQIWYIHSGRSRRTPTACGSRDQISKIWDPL